MRPSNQNGCGLVTLKLILWSETDLQVHAGMAHLDNVPFGDRNPSTPALTSLALVLQPLKTETIPSRNRGGRELIADRFPS